jgi:hypothetical protein
MKKAQEGMSYRGVAFELMIDLYEWITDRRIVFPAHLSSNVQHTEYNIGSQKPTVELQL